MAEPPDIQRAEGVGSESDPLRVPGVDRLAEGHAKKIRFDVDGDDDRSGELVLCRVDGELYALDTLCPHEGGRISEGPLMERRYTLCPLHLYRFDPRDGAAVGIECPPARTYRVEERGTQAVIWLDDER